MVRMVYGIDLGIAVLFKTGNGFFINLKIKYRINEN